MTTNLRTLSDGAARKPPSITVANPRAQLIKRRGLSGLAADEPDRVGMLIAVFFVLTTLLTMTVALGLVILNG